MYICMYVCMYTYFLDSQCHVMYCIHILLLRDARDHQFGGVTALDTTNQSIEFDHFGQIGYVYIKTCISCIYIYVYIVYI